MIHRPTALVAAVALLLVCLAGCAQPHASASHPAPSNPTPSGTPAAAVPIPVLPVGCADLVPLATLQTDISSGVTVQRDENSEPVGWNAVVERQAGALDCAWGTDDRTDATFDDGLSMTVVADATAAFDAFSATNGFQTGVATTVGDRSGIRCADGVPICSGDVLAGSSWLEFTYSAKTHGGDVAKDVVAVVGGAAARLKGAGPAKAAWAPPSGALTAPDCTPGLGTKLAGVSVQVAQPQQEGGSARQEAVVAERAHEAGCTWETGPAGTSGDIFTMSVLVSYHGSLVLFSATVDSTAADADEKAAVDGMASRLVASLGSAS